MACDGYSERYGKKKACTLGDCTTAIMHLTSRLRSECSQLPRSQETNNVMRYSLLLYLTPGGNDISIRQIKASNTRAMPSNNHRAPFAKDSKIRLRHRH